MHGWLLVLFLTDVTVAPVSIPVESRQACHERASVEAFHLEMTGRPVSWVECHRAPRLRPATGEIVTR